MRSLRFFGNGVGDIDRVKVRIDERVLASVRLEANVAVPEPGAAALFALGAGLIAARSRSRASN